MINPETVTMPDEIYERFYAARDERIEALALVLLAGAPLAEVERTTAVRVMLATASREAFESLQAEEAAASGITLSAPEPDVFGDWQREQPGASPH